jgi:ADP-heptose:LPS heptosyltransferase
MQDSALLRVTDKYAGSALCAAVSLLRSWQARAGNPPKIEKVLLVELFEMGASIMLIPSIKEIQKKYPNAEIHCLTTSSCLPVWNSINCLAPEKIHVINSKSALSLVLSALKTVWKLRSIKFDLVIDYELFMRVPAVLVGLLKAKARAGFFKYDYEGLYRGSFYDHFSAYNQNSHIARNFLALTRTALGGERANPNHKGHIDLQDLKIEPTAVLKDRSSVLKLLGKPADIRYFVICPDVGKTLAMRNYPKSLFAELIQKLLSKYPEHNFVAIGTEAEMGTSAEIFASVGSSERLVNLCGRTNFSQLMQIIAGAELVITNDNGPGHFATLTGTKALALFSTDSPYVYGPLGDAVIAYSNYHCSPCISAFNHKTSRCDDNKCLQVLSPNVLLGYVEAIMAGNARYRTINNSIPYLY